MTIQKARQILKEDAIKLTDDEVELIIKNCSAMCDVILNLFISENKKLKIDRSKVLN